MKLRMSLVSSALAIAGALYISQATAADKATAQDKAAPSKDAPKMDEMMKNWMAAATPGAPHKTLEPLAGDWDVVARFWMAGPDSPPSESKGTAKSHWIMGSRFLQQDVTSEMMNMPFQGMGLTGYDNMKKKYVSVWVDNMGTAISTSEGTADRDAKVFTFLGKMDDPMTGEKDKTMKSILRILGPDKHVLEMHDLSLGDKSKTGEITYTRKSGS